MALKRRLAALSGPGTRPESQWLVAERGWKLLARVHRPACSRDLAPAVLLVPGTQASGRIFERWRSVVHVQELAALGCVSLCLDLSGRGQSWGNDDYGGPDQQGDVRSALRYLARRPDVDPRRIGVVSLGSGSVAVAGALVSGNRPEVRFWIDWEGPSDREIVSASHAGSGPPLDDDSYWHPREPVRFVGQTGVPYLRYQARIDHLLRGEPAHAERMMIAAAAGDLPWFQLNEHVPGELPYAPKWMPPGVGVANQWIRDRIREQFQVS